MKDLEINLRLAFDFWPDDAIHRNGEEVIHNRKKVDYREPKVMQRLLYALDEITISVRGGYVIVNQIEAPTMAKAVPLAYLKLKENTHGIQAGNRNEQRGL